MSNKNHIILCSGIQPKRLSKGEIMKLAINDNINFEIRQLEKQLALNLPTFIYDLLEIATYVYAADQATSRGGETFQNNGADWRRIFDFRIPVREKALWESEPMKKVLIETLTFVSDDQYSFEFYDHSQSPDIQSYFNFETSPVSGNNPETVMLFSGGLDSFAGSIEEAFTNNRKTVLVTHCSTSKSTDHQIKLVKDLQQKTSNIIHVPVWVNKGEGLNKEYTQRTRSFLYASIGVAVASAFGLKSIKFYENGVTSVNLPIAGEVVGVRASRTTHPKTIQLYSKLFSTLFGENFSVETPFLVKTKTEVVQYILDKNFGDMISFTSSCSHTWERTKQHSHCGTCSQCVDRRFATLAAGCSEEQDPSTIYEVDLYLGERTKLDHIKMLTGFVETARKISKLSKDAFLQQYPELGRVIRCIPGKSIDDSSIFIYELYTRHAKALLSVIDQGIKTYSEKITMGEIPSNCLLSILMNKGESNLEEIGDYLLCLSPYPGKQKNLFALLKGKGDFQGLVKPIGSRELFFLYHLFTSDQVVTNRSEEHAAVAEPTLAEALKGWSNAGWLKYTGKDSPKSRLTKMWKAFTEQMEKENKFKKFFAIKSHDATKERSFIASASPKSLWNELKDLSTIFN